MALSSLLSNELIHHVSEQLTGIDLFHFTLINGQHLSITSHHLKHFLRFNDPVSLNENFEWLSFQLSLPHSMTQSQNSLVLSSYGWNDFIYGAFRLSVIERSLKYFSTDLFFLYCRLWSFNPFYYPVSYPMLNIFDYPCMYLCSPSKISFASAIIA